ncbi:hypothetical protein RhiirB3_450998 [Rhizophagus irregularis]|nr:hypothetical protein RhiirB3_450998 [Rhizophagus irregularis]
MIGKNITTQTLTVLKKNKFTSLSEEIIAIIEFIMLKIDDEIVKFFIFDDDDDENQQNIIETEFNDNEVGNGAYQSILSLLDIVIPILIKSESPVLKVGDKINIKLNGNGRNVSCKQKHVMLTICILNKGEAVLNPSHMKIAKFSHKYKQLKDEYKASDSTIWPIELAESL